MSTKAAAPKSYDIKGWSAEEIKLDTLASSRWAPTREKVAKNPLTKLETLKWMLDNGERDYYTKSEMIKRLTDPETIRKLERDADPKIKEEAWRKACLLGLKRE
jgi:hypothetical protein